MAFPLTTTGSLRPTFVSGRHVSLSVKLPSAFALFRAISVRAEETFGRLRYSLGGDRPSQTARLTVSPDRIHGRRLETQQYKSGIPPATPHKLTPVFLSLPPILYMYYRISVLSCSKAPWGLSV